MEWYFTKSNILFEYFLFILFYKNGADVERETCNYRRNVNNSTWMRGQQSFTL